MIPFLAQAGRAAGRAVEDQLAVLRAAVPLVQERMNTLSESVDMLGFLFVDEDAFTLDPDAAGKVLTGDAGAVLEASVKALGDVDWTTEAIEAALRVARRRTRPEAEERLRPGPGGDLRTPDLAAAVRVAGTAGPGEVAAPARAGPRVATG